VNSQTAWSGRQGQLDVKEHTRVLRIAFRVPSIWAEYRLSFPRFSGHEPKQRAVDRTRLIRGRGLGKGPPFPSLVRSETKSRQACREGAAAPRSGASKDGTLTMQI
jgi:hypothetical protein